MEHPMEKGQLVVARREGAWCVRGEEGAWCSGSRGSRRETNNTQGHGDRLSGKKTLNSIL